MSPPRRKITDVRIEDPGQVTYRWDGAHVVAQWPLLLIRLAWEAGANMEDLADGFGRGLGTMDDWSAIRDSSDEAIARMVGRAIEFFEAQAGGPRARLNPQYSEAARGFLSEEIPRLVRRGMPQRQAVAAALSQARRAGLKVPARNPGTLALINRPKPSRYFPEPVYFGEAVYEVRYRHAGDRADYVHTFEHPDLVTLHALSPLEVLMYGQEPIVQDTGF